MAGRAAELRPRRPGRAHTPGFRAPANRGAQPEIARYRIAVLDSFGNPAPNPRIEASASFGRISNGAEDETTAVVTLDTAGLRRNAVRIHAPALDGASQITDTVFFDPIVTRHSAAYPSHGSLDDVQRSERTPAHALGHVFSTGGVVDSSHENADTLGANRRNNPSIDQGNGTDINRPRCSLMDWNHRRSNR